MAQALGGHVHTGQDADVEHERIRVECKRRKGLVLDSSRELREWADQVERYRKTNPGKHFTIQVTGGKEFQNGRMWFFMDEELYKQLTSPDSLGMVLQELQRIRTLLESGHSEG